MRGKAFPRLARLGRGGITPAYAGKSMDAQEWESASRDHPRVCGEKARAHAHAFLYLGSPPRMRGKGSAREVSDRQKGITPAYAGKRPDPL